MRVIPALVALGCASDAAVAPPPASDVTQMYWALTLSHHAVTLSTVAPYDTIRITATPRAYDGKPLTGLPAPTFTSLDPKRAIVTPDGLVRVIKTGTKVPVEATLTAGNLRHADTVFINITNLATPPVLASLSIQPPPGDSAKVAVSDFKTITARALTADSTAISGLAVYYASTDPTKATIDRATGTIGLLRPSHVKLIATATAYGVTKTDTLLLTIGYPTSSIYINVTSHRNAGGQMVNGFYPAEVTVGPGAIVWFINMTDAPTDVTFDDPTNVAQADMYCAWMAILCGTGNIEAWMRDSADTDGVTGVRMRSFPVPGTYTYHSTIFGTTAKIIVANEPADIP